MSTAQAYPADMAAIYDRLFSDYAKGLAPRIYALFERRYDASGGSAAMLDLCCGSGTIARYFAERGVESFGVDASRSMIEAAERASSGISRPPRLIVAEADAFNLPHSVPFCASTFAAMNHFETRAHFAAVTARVLEHLEPGGTFIFDLRTRITLDQINGDTVINREDSFQLWRHVPDKSRGRTITAVDGFVLDEETGQYRRFALVYTLQTYPLADVRALMISQGWADVAFAGFHDFDTQLDDPERVSTAIVIATAPTVTAPRAIGTVPRETP